MPTWFSGGLGLDTDIRVCPMAPGPTDSCGGTKLARTRPSSERAENATLSGSEPRRLSTSTPNTPLRRVPRSSFSGFTRSSAVVMADAELLISSTADASTSVVPSEATTVNGCVALVPRGGGFARRRPWARVM